MTLPWPAPFFYNREEPISFQIYITKSSIECFLSYMSMRISLTIGKSKARSSTTCGHSEPWEAQTDTFFTIILELCWTIFTARISICLWETNILIFLPLQISEPRLETYFGWRLGVIYQAVYTSVSKVLNYISRPIRIRFLYIRHIF